MVEWEKICKKLKAPGFKAKGSPNPPQSWRPS